MDLHDVAISRLNGRAGTVRDLSRGGPALVVNVASHCGHTMQYADLQELFTRYCDRGVVVIGVPCNQFAEEEPGSPGEIAAFCSTRYGVTFPMTEKIRVNGRRRHPLYAALSRAADADGYRGDIRWNFEKFLLDPRGVAVARFAPAVSPLDFRVVESIDAFL